MFLCNLIHLDSNSITIYLGLSSLISVQVQIALLNCQKKLQHLKNFKDLIDDEFLYFNLEETNQFFLNSTDSLQQNQPHGVVDAK